MEEIERGMREAALRDGSRALSMLLREIPDCYEKDVICTVCGKLMDNLGRREKEIISLLGEGTVSRMYYECTVPDHRFSWQLINPKIKIHKVFRNVCFKGLCGFF